MEPTKKYEIDEPLEEFKNEITNIQTSGNIKESNLYKYLSDSVQRNINTHDGDIAKQLDVLLQAYEFDKYKKTFCEDIKDRLTLFTRLEENHKRFQQIFGFIKTNNIENLKKITLESGVYPVLTTAMYLTIKRFRDVFKVPNFLYCYMHTSLNTTTNIQTLIKNLVFSRWYYIIKGIYLPVIAFYGGNAHATTTIFYPSIVNSVETWHIIYINSNGISYINRAETDPEFVMLTYENYLQNQQSNLIDVQVSICSENIQQKYGTCAMWSLILAMFILIQNNKITLDKYGSKHINIINLYCFMLSQSATNPKFIDKFNDYINDLYVSFLILIYDVMLNLFQTNKLDCFNLVNYLLKGDAHKIIQVDIIIFDAVKNSLSDLQQHFEEKPKKKSIKIYISLLIEDLSLKLHGLKKQLENKSLTREELEQIYKKISKLNTKQEVLRQIYDEMYMTITNQTGDEINKTGDETSDETGDETGDENGSLNQLKRKADTPTNKWNKIVEYFDSDLKQSQKHTPRQEYIPGQVRRVTHMSPKQSPKQSPKLLQVIPPPVIRMFPKVRSVIRLPK